MKIQITDFNKKYSNEIYELQTAQWGFWDDETKIEKVCETEIILVALLNNQFAGFVSGQLEEEIFHLKICCVKPEFQKNGIGSKLLTEIIKKAEEKFVFKKFRAEAISVYGKCNAQKMLQNLNFNFVRTDKSYWGKLYPHVLCTECLKTPCECDSLVYELDNKKSIC